MKANPLFLLFFLCLGFWVQGQIKIGDNPQNLDPGAVLELESTNKALVITRVNTAQMNAIQATRGAVVYNTDTECVHYFDGTEWKSLCDARTVFSSDPVVNSFPTMVITDTDDGTIHFEVEKIHGTENIFPNSIGQQSLNRNSVGNEQMQDNSVSSDNIQDGQVQTVDIADGAVTADKIGGNVAGPGLIQNAIGALQVDVTALTGDGDITSTDLTVTGGTDAAFNDVTLEISPGAVGNTEIAGDAVTTDKIADGTIVTADIQDNAIDKTKINADVAGTGLLQAADGSLQIDPTTNTGDGTLSSPLGTIAIGGTPNNSMLEDVELEVADNAITSAKIAGDAVTTDKIADGTIVTADIRDNAIDKTKINADVAGTGLLQAADGSLQIDPTTNTGDGTLSSPLGTIAIGGTPNNSLLEDVELEVADNAITTAKILDGNVTDQKLDKANISLSGFAVPTADLSIGTNKLTDVMDPTDLQDAATKNYVDNAVGVVNTLADGAIYVGDVSNTAQEITLNGDATMDNTGILTIANDAITTVKILDGNVTPAKIEPAASFNQTLVTDGTGTVAWVPSNSGSGDPNDELQDLQISGSVLSLSTPLTTGNQVVLTDVQTSVADNTTISGTGTTVNPFTVKDLGISGAKLDKANIPLSGFGLPATNISMNGNQINNLADPTVAQDAATMNYVDNAVGVVNTLADGAIYVGDVSNTAQEITLNGDATMDNTGILTIANDAITTVKILDKNVTPAKIANGTANQVLKTNVAGTDTEWGTLDANNITGQDLTPTDGSITINNGTGATLINTDISVADAGITTVKIADDAVTATKINADIVGNGLTQLASGALQVDVTALSGDGTLSTPNGSVIITGTPANSLLENVGIDVKVDGNTLNIDSTNGVQVADNGITNAKIADNAVTSAKIANGTIATADIADDAVDATKINSDVAGTGLQQNAVTGALEINPAQVPGDGTLSTPNSSLTITGTPANSLLENVGIDVKVDGNTLNIDSTNGVQVADNGITNAKITDNAVTSAKIANGTIATADIADDAVDATKINSDVAGTGLQQNAATGALEINPAQVPGDGTLSTPNSSLTITGTPANSLLENVGIDVKVDGNTLNIDSTNGVQVADNGITTAKIAPGAANQILRTNAGGTATEWTAPAVRAMGKVDPTATVAYINGAVVTRNGPGNYTVTLANPLPTNKYIIQLTLFSSNPALSIKVTAQNTNDFTVQISELEVTSIADTNVPPNISSTVTSTPADADWYFTVTDF